MIRAMIRLGLALSSVAIAAPALAADAAPLDLSVAYYGETGYHPGVSLSLERPVWESGWNRLYVAGQAGYYDHLNTYRALFAGGNVGYRLTLPIGLSMDASLGLGGMYQALVGEVYARSASGAFEPTTDWGRPALTPSLALGLGYDLSGLGLKGDRAFLQLQTFGEYPVNTMLVSHLAALLGIQWQLGR